MASQRDFAMKERHFYRRKRALRVREIMEQFEDKTTITPELIIEMFNNSTSSSSSMDDQDQLSLEEVARMLFMYHYRSMRRSPDHVPPSGGDWLRDRLFRFKFVVGKLGGVDRAKPCDILEAMRINCDHDYHLTLAEVEFNLSARVTYLKAVSPLFKHRRRVFENMFPAPLISIEDHSESLSQELEKLSMSANKNEIRGSGGPTRRGRRVIAAGGSSMYTRMDVVDNSGAT